VRYITFHRGLLPQFAALPQRAWLAWHGIEQMGFRPVTTGGVITLFRLGPRTKTPAAPPVREPRTLAPIYCGGWYPPTRAHPRIRTMAWSHAPGWVKGNGSLIVLASSGTPLRATFSVDGRRRETTTVSKVTIVPLRLRTQGWHLVTIDVPRLVRVDGRPIGLDVVMIHRGIRIVP